MGDRVEQKGAFEYLESLLKQTYFHGQWVLEWYGFNHYFELKIQCPLTHQGSGKLRDISRHEVADETFLYEFSVLFYDSGEITMDKVGAIKAFPIHPKNGIRQGDLMAVVIYLKQLSGSVRIQWEEYLRHPGKEPFALEWDDQTLAGINKDLKNRCQYSRGRLYFTEG